MRISGVILLFMAVFHLFYMHFVIGVERMDFNTIAGRWGNPLWRIFDFFLLTFALLHGGNGLRVVLDDYLSRRPGWRAFAKAFVFLLAVGLVSIGGFIIFTFQVPVTVATVP
jgi:succinate dehydrogenase / fumarate reductase membrane anchor subunit